MKQKIDLELLPRKNVSTGYADLDNLLSGGFKAGELVLIKQNTTFQETSCLALNIAQNICAAGTGVCFFSLNDEASNLLKYTQAFWNDVENKKCGVIGSFIIEDNALNLPDIKDRIKYNKSVKNVECIVVDGIDGIFDEHEHWGHLDPGYDSCVDAYICADYLQRIARAEEITIIASLTIDDNSSSQHTEIACQLADIVLDTSLKNLPEMQVIVEKCNHNSCKIRSNLKDYSVHEF
nr:hypothetical protein [Clostridia bacterium]